MAGSDLVVHEPSVRGVVPVDIDPSGPRRPRLLVLGTALASAAVAMGFIGMLAHYIAERAAVIQTGERWLPEGVTIPLTQPNFQGLTLALSVVTIWWAVSSIRNDDRFYSVVATGLTLLFGFAFIGQTFFLFDIMEADITAEGANGARALLLYAIIGTHLVLTVIAMVYALIMGFRVLSGEFSSRDYEGVLASATFWTVMVALYGVMWYVIYITK